MKACLTTEALSAEQAVAEAIRGEGVIGMDYVKEVTASAPYQWDPDDDESALWSVARGSADEVRHQALPPVRHRIVAYDYGIKENILRRLRQAGFGVTVVPASTTAEEVLALKPDGVFLSNGPGDPAALDYAHEAVRGLIGRTPIFGICLGHQVLGYAFGGRTFKLKFGHRGGNQPVKDLRTGKVAITSQNHGFAVDAGFAPARNRSHARESQRRHRGRNAASRACRFSACNIIPKRRPARMTPDISSRSLRS